MLITDSKIFDEDLPEKKYDVPEKKYDFMILDKKLKDLKSKL